MYAEKGITIVEPQVVNIAVFQKAEIYTARQELRRMLCVLETTREPGFRKETQLELSSMSSSISFVNLHLQRVALDAAM
jgi:hypothetical protein